MMDDIIYRKDAAKILCNWCGVCPEDKRDIMNCDDICPEFAKIPSAQSADAVEVVRCENCDYWHRSNEGFSYGMCTKVWMNRDATFYCKSGERKTDA